MTTDEAAPEAAPGEELDKLNANIARIEELSQRLAAALAHQEPVRPGLQGPGQELYQKAAGAWMAGMMSHPGKFLETQISYWGQTLKNVAEAQQQALSGQAPAEEGRDSDRRFANPLWETNPYFHFLKQQYLATSAVMRETVDEFEGLDETDRQRLDYFTRQMIDMMAPTNFLATNPDALERAVETEGQSLVDGLENLVRDLEDHHGQFLVNLADKEAFTVGENIATAEGAVVYRNRMMELIQYAPQSDKVHAIPLVIFPPWINKFYILDLKPENSLIRWITEQGFTLFVVSWVNPDENYAECGLETYIEEGFLAAIREARAITGQKKVNVVGYCIAGTVLALLLALMKKRRDRSINSATFFTTLTDFSDQGEFTAFLSDDFIDGIEEEVKDKGILSSLYMSRTFSFLRANDLVYGPAIRSYMLGEAPPAFDLLYWNGDSTNLPKRMAIEYLRGLCQSNDFAGEGFDLMGERLRLSDIDLPLCAVACESDHIAPWKQSYAGIRQMGSLDKMFITSQSGHIAGIVNPPSKKKYGHFTNKDWPAAPDDWMAGADFHEGSWWPRWRGWLGRHSGKMVPARPLGDEAHPPLAPAPGTYVKTPSGS